MKVPQMPRTWRCKESAPWIEAVRRLAGRGNLSTPEVSDTRVNGLSRAPTDGILRAPRHGPAPHHAAHRSAAGARARRARQAARDRALVPRAVGRARGAVLLLRGPAQQRLQAGTRRHEPLP